MHDFAFFNIEKHLPFLTFTVLWTNQTLSLRLLCFSTWLRWRPCVRFLICYIFGRRPKGGGAWPKWPNGKYASELSIFVVSNFHTVNVVYKEILSWLEWIHSRV